VGVPTYLPGRAYQKRENVFDQISEILQMKIEPQRIEYVCAFDSETLLIPKRRKISQQTTVIGRLQVFALGAAHNIEGLDQGHQVFSQLENGDGFLELFLDYLFVISRKREEILRKRYQPYFTMLQEKLRLYQGLFVNNRMAHKVQKAIDQLDLLCSQLRVFGFNSR